VITNIDFEFAPDLLLTDATLLSVSHRSRTGGREILADGLETCPKSALDVASNGGGRGFENDVGSFDSCFEAMVLRWTGNESSRTTGGVFCIIVGWVFETETVVCPA